MNTMTGSVFISMITVKIFFLEIFIFAKCNFKIVK